MTGLDLSGLAEGDRAEVERFAAYLAARKAYREASRRQCEVVADPSSTVDDKARAKSDVRRAAVIAQRAYDDLMAEPPGA